MTELAKTKDGRHRFKWMKFDGKNVRIDADIVPLLSKMWSLGIRTTNSCHGSCSFMCKHKYRVVKDKHGNYYESILTKECHSHVWLAFESSADVEKLYDAVAEYDVDDSSMYGKMSCGQVLQTKGSPYRRQRDGWSFLFLMTNEGIRGRWGRPTVSGKRLTREVWIEHGNTRNEFVIQPQITFPRAHIEYVERRLDEALAKHG